MNLINNIYMILGLLISLPICGVIIHGIGMVMNLVSDRYKKYEWINSILAVIVIFILFAMLSVTVVIAMMITPVLLIILFITMVIAIIDYFIRG